MQADGIGAVSRRAVVGTGGVLAAATLAGCAAPPAPPTVAPTAVGSAGTRLGPAADVPVGGGHVFTDLEVVVTQPSAGEFRGFSAECTHTGCIVGSVTDGLIVCPCHGSRYRLDGTVADGPAPRPLRPRAVRQVDGNLELA
ncbi:Rieske (2Fe-2S) protein [Pseudonocardia sp. CA-107938]|uniref:Rieske (2Fe-2S) protein n=1 Tax=Pseudonocardia sp. CA-107938 TaxID=3240021 RepID=UPI003D8DC2C1